MPWVRVDTGFRYHPKVLRLTRAERCTWMEILCYCGEHSKHGELPDVIHEAVPFAKPAFLEKCRELGLLDLVDNSLVVHDWDEYNPPRAEISSVNQAVADYLTTHPNASANDVARALPLGRKQVLASVRRFRGGSRGGSHSGSGAGSENHRLPVSYVPAGAFPSPSTTRPEAVTTREGDPDELEPGPTERPRDQFNDPTEGRF